jgi:hypothetical protein
MLLEWARPATFFAWLVRRSWISFSQLDSFCLVHGISICNDSIGESLLFEGFE